MSTTFTRRSFVAGTGAALMGATIVATSGCSPKETRKTTMTETAEEMPSIDPSSVSVVEDCDVVVCGSGSSGTYAAIRAAERGAHVIWLEKNSSKGGTSYVTEGMCAPNGQQQLASQAPTDLQAFYEDEMNWHSWGASSEAIWAYLNNAGKAVDWAIEHGAMLVYGGFPEAPMYSCKDENGWVNMGTGMLTPLWAYGDTLTSLDSRVNAPVVDLIMDGDKVVGVYAKDSDGKTVQINAKAVVLATGGWGRNPEMVAKRLPVPASRVVFCGMDGQDGDGINLALKAGARENGHGNVMYGWSKVVGEPWDSILSVFTQWPPTWRVDFEGTIPVGKCLPMVNHEGLRFYNETRADEFNTSRLNTAIANQPKVFTLFDKEHCDTYSSFTDFDYGTGIAKGNFAEKAEQCASIYKSDSIEGLAETIGVPVENLVATVDGINARANGEDSSGDPFGADVSYLAPLQVPPFYAAEIEANAYGSLAGIRTNGFMNAVRVDGSAIEGLYVCGQDNGSFWFNNYGNHGGSGQAICCTSGFVAAETICDSLGF